jgi:hypothetical protein
MIDRQHNAIVFECDGCDETLETGETEFPDALSMFRRDGWKSEKVGDEWVHLCPACRRRP